MIEMVCTCKAEGVREVETRRLRIFHRMGLEDMGDLTQAIILSLAFDFQAVGEVYSDQWFGVALETPLVERGLSVECDWPTDGLAALWEELAEKFPERVSVKPKTNPMAVKIMERISAGLLSNYEAAEETYREHRAAAHKDDNDCLPCEDCSVFMSLSITAHHVLDEAWGSRDMEKTIEKALD